MSRQWSQSDSFLKETQGSPSENERLNLILDAAEVGIWEWDPSTQQVTWNAQHEILMGYEPGHPHRTSEDFYSRVHPDDREHVFRASLDIACERKPLETQYRVIWPDGSVHWMQSRGKVLRNRSQQAILIVGVVRDITEQKHNEQALLQTKRELDFLLDFDKRVSA